MQKKKKTPEEKRKEAIQKIKNECRQEIEELLKNGDLEVKFVDEDGHFGYGPMDEVASPEPTEEKIEIK